MRDRSRCRRWFVVTCLAVGLSIPWLLSGYLGLCFVRFYRFFVSINHGDNDFERVGYFSFGAVLFLTMTVCLGASAQVTAPTIRRIRNVLEARPSNTDASESTN